MLGNPITNELSKNNKYLSPLTKMSRGVLASGSIMIDIVYDCNYHLPLTQWSHVSAPLYSKTP